MNVLSGMNYNPGETLNKNILAAYLKEFPIFTWNLFE